MIDDHQEFRLEVKKQEPERLKDLAENLWLKNRAIDSFLMPIGTTQFSAKRDVFVVTETNCPGKLKVSCGRQLCLEVV